MRIGRGKGKEQVDDEYKKGGRKDTCCYKYGPGAWIRKFRNYLKRRCNRSINKKIFGDPDPKMSDYEVGGHTVSSYMNVLTGSKSNNSQKKNAPVETLFRNIKSLPIANISLKDLQLIDGHTASELKKKFTITGSKASLLDELVKEYKKGNLSMSGISKSKKYEEKVLDEQKLNKIIKQYEKVRKKSVANLDQVKNMDKDELKRKFSLSGSKGKVFNEMIDDYRAGKISLSRLTNSKTEPKKLNKEQMDVMLKAYEDSKKSRKIYFPSKILSIKSYYYNMQDSLTSLRDKIVAPSKNKY